MTSGNSVWKGVRVGVTSGPTRAWIDPVRYLANASTGELGSLVADLLSERGASVDLLHGFSAVSPKCAEIRRHPIDTVSDLRERLEEFSLEGRDSPFRIWIHAMAVLDYAPVTSDRKFPSGDSEWILQLHPTPKIIDRLKPLFPGALIVGFKLETAEDLESLRLSAEDLHTRTGCELVVANDAPFRRPEAHSAHLYDPRAAETWFGPILGKRAIAEALVNRLETKLAAHVPA